ncbi:hypothetical protein UFOVP263_39 [uncultured Caudovirales phage]|uniref:Uncharacterized protein n=1 Tax=uncultured Caudovirales phage TaxID=2100421 RepID=A0A6J5TAT8_9CAUD|nr:hypothetical protein UFOVP263_39 [uncultured Caudovirales phage]CAB4242030.1 hypothetical protein UFOVP91_23 [uncultured Caudovirales phage]
MIEVKLAHNQFEKQIVIENMRGVSPLSNSIVWGFWKENKCFGGVSLSGSFLNEYTIGFSIKPSMELGLAIYLATCEALKINSRLVGKIQITNTASRKGARQLGFRRVYIDGDIEVMELANIPAKMHKRWSKYV